MAKIKNLSDEEVQAIINEENASTNGQENEELKEEQKKDEEFIDKLISENLEELNIDNESKEEEKEEEEEGEYVNSEEEKKGEDTPEPPEPEKEEESEKGQSWEFEGINLADFITAEMAITTYQDFWVMLLSGVAMLLKKDIHEDKIRVSKDIEEMSVNLLDIYWQTVKIKINPVMAAAILMAGANITNFTNALREEHKKPKQKKQSQHKRRKPPQNVTDVEYEEVKEETPESNKEESDEDLQNKINALIKTHNENKQNPQK